VERRKRKVNKRWSGFACDDEHVLGDRLLTMTKMMMDKMTVMMALSQCRKNMKTNENRPTNSDSHLLK
jgi:hypothetical protein